MKPLLTLLLALVTLFSFAQKRDNTTATTDTSKHTATAASLSLTSERDFYKKMYELAQTNADKAHSDTQWGYGINVTVIVAIIAIILAIQLVNTRSELQRVEQRIVNDVQVQREIIEEEVAESQRAVLAQLSTLNTTNVATIEQRLGTLQSSFDKTENTLRDNIQREINSIRNQFTQPVAAAYIRPNRIAPHWEVPYLEEYKSEHAALAASIKSNIEAGSDIKKEVERMLVFYAWHRELEQAKTLIEEAKSVLNTLDKEQHKEIREQFINSFNGISQFIMKPIGHTADQELVYQTKYQLQ